MNSAFLQQLKVQQVRDLYCAINGPSVADLPGLTHWQDDSPDFHQRLLALDANPTPLLQHLSDHPQSRLGLYFETLWHFYFDQHPRFERLASNLQIQPDRQTTLGELDLIVQDHIGNQSLHIELAIKFYLNPWNHQTQPLRHWVGPELRDRFDFKYEKTLTQQLPLSQHPCTHEILLEQKLSIDKSIAIMKGTLFSQGATAQQRNVWMTQEQLLQTWPNQKARYLPKRLWLSPLHPDEHSGIAQLPSLLEANADNSPYQIALLSDQNDEIGRCFVVNACWQQRAQAFTQLSAKKRLTSSIDSD
ncbi:DUF1853 family protein [Nitrincola nitratireducens]|uniref:DUF1853 domain-containing protein n=1 Tax=Nitrincola nitratireducens TaxID=1229521 RepID=W9V9U5_9GAMM|nr:DUF1853 family protein [Nitrincola nitratireducens]EXJ12807.1 hypothetical protein D791_00149 [Nitrincola nitratireducens]